MSAEIVEVFLGYQPHLICAQRRVVQAPVAEIVVLRLPVPASCLSILAAQLARVKYASMP